MIGTTKVSGARKGGGNMKSKLSALKFVRNNKKQVWVMVIALSLTFMTMYVVNFLLMTTQESFQTIFLEQPKYLTMFRLTNEAAGIDITEEDTEETAAEKRENARNRIIEDLKKIDGIRNVYYTQSLYASYNAIVGQVGYTIPLLSQEEIPEYLDHMGAKLVEGRMPSGDGEMLVDEVILKNSKKSVGDWYEEKAFGQVFKIVGAVESDKMVCVGMPYGYTNTGWYFMVLCDEAHSDMTQMLKQIGIEVSENDTINDAPDWERAYEEVVEKQITTAITAIMIVVTVFLAISILVAYVSFLRNRVNEYCLYMSIGFARQEVYGMIIREILLIFGGSICLGVVLTAGLEVTLAKIILDPLGLCYRYFYWEQFCKIITAFIVIIGLLQIPISVTVNSIKTIDRMEE